MPAIIGSTSIAAGATTENVVEGSNFEFIVSPSDVMFSAVSVAAANGADVQCTFNLGGTSLLLPPFGTIFLTNNLTIPNDIYHNLVRVGAAPGERLFVTFQNSAANAQTVRWSLRIDPRG